MYGFGDLKLDVGARELRRAGSPVHLEPQAFDLLAYLIEHRDRVVPKHELLDRVWGHNFLSEANLTTRIKEIRRAVGDDGRQQHTIKNARGRGYRFVAEVRDESAPLGRARSTRSSLIGRDADLQAVLDLLEQSPLVTLTGAGGVGKSALAAAAAMQLNGTCDDGVHLIELGAVPSGEDVVPAIARTLDVVLDSARPDGALQAISRLDAVLVLDGCEHVVDAASEFVARLFGVTGARARVLATSQVRLGLSAETVVSVAPLDVEHAAALFTVRARAVQPSWDPHAIGPERIARLIASLDRLPLTIEMAAGRIGSMTFDDLERAIAERLPLLQMSHRAPTRRHRSLGSLVAWSAELLDTPQRELFTRFSVFAGPVTAAEAGAVLAPDAPGSVTFDLAALAERSLLVADGTRSQTRYAMFTTVRAVAEQWLEQSGRAETERRRHAEHVAEVLGAIDDQLRTTQEGDGRRRLEDLVDEARAAHRWARQDDPALASRMSAALFHAAYSSLWHEPAEWSRALLASHAGAAEPRYPGATLLVAAAAAHRGDLVFARERASAVAAAAEGRLRAIAIELLADVALYEGDLDGARRAGDELRRIGDRLGDRHAATFGVVDAALARIYGGEPQRALDDLAGVDARELAPTDRAWLALTRGDALSALGDPAAAADYLAAIELGSSVGNRFVVSASMTSLATEYARSGAMAAALDAFGVALRSFVRHGNHTHAVTAMRNLVGVLENLGDERAATVIAGAMSSERLRVSYGREAEQIVALLDRTQRRVGSSRFGEWFSHGQSLDLHDALLLAVEIVERHRRESSDDPHTAHEQSGPSGATLDT